MNQQEHTVFPQGCKRPANCSAQPTTYQGIKGGKSDPCSGEENQKRSRNLQTCNCDLGTLAWEMYDELKDSN